MKIGTHTTAKSTPVIIAIVTNIILIANYRKCIKKNFQRDDVNEAKIYINKTDIYFASFVRTYFGKG